MKRTLAVLTAASVTAGLLLATGGPTRAAEPVTTAPAAAAVPADTLTWRRCRDVSLEAAGARCARVKVPLRWSRPDGRKISLAIARVRHTAPADQYRGVMLVNPGGPGGAGRQYATLGGLVPGDAGGRYDWVGFDPRGVGASRPAVRCQRRFLAPVRPDYETRTRRAEREWRRLARGYARACARKNGKAMLRGMRTTSVARDMDAIRAALGAPSISFYGFSYGSYLGQVYATLFPDRLDRMVLDANVDPGAVWYRANLRQTAAFDRNLNKWFAWLARHHDEYRLGRTRKKVRRAWMAERRALSRRPAGGRIGPAEWTDTFLYAGYYESTWVELADAWYVWAKEGDWRPLAAEHASFNPPRDDNSYAVYVAVSCVDAPWPRRWKRWRRDARRLSRTDPFLAWSNTWFNAPCHRWPVRAGARVKVRGTQTPTLLVNGTLDAATPYDGALRVRRLFPSSSLVAVRRGITHAGSLGGNRCVDRAVAAFLADGTRPARRSGDRADLVCARGPLPDPKGGPGGFGGFARGGVAVPLPRPVGLPPPRG